MAQPGKSGVSDQSYAVSENPWLGKADVSIFLCQRSDPRTGGCTGGEVTADQRSAIEKRLLGLPQVEHVWYESEEEAFRNFLEQNADSPPAQSVTVDQVPDSFRVKLVSPAEAEAVADQLANVDGVYTVQPIRPIDTGR